MCLLFFFLIEKLARLHYATFEYTTYIKFGKKEIIYLGLVLSLKRQTLGSILKRFLKLFPYFKIIFSMLVFLMTHEIKQSSNKIQLVYIYK